MIFFVVKLIIILLLSEKIYGVSPNQCKVAPFKSVR